MKFNLERVENSLKYNIEELFKLGLPKNSDAAINLARMILRMLANIKKLQDQVENNQKIDNDTTIKESEIALQKNLEAVNDYIINTIVAFIPSMQKDSVQFITNNIRATVLEAVLEMRRLLNEEKKSTSNNVEDEQIDKTVDYYISILNKLFDRENVNIIHDKDNSHADPVLKIIISDKVFHSKVQRVMLAQHYSLFFMGLNEFQLLLTKNTKSKLMDQQQFNNLKTAISPASKNESFIGFNKAKKMRGPTQGLQKKKLTETIQSESTSISEVSKTTNQSTTSVNQNSLNQLAASANSENEHDDINQNPLNQLATSANSENEHDDLNLDGKKFPTSNFIAKNDDNKNNDRSLLIDLMLKGVFRLVGEVAGGYGGLVAGGILGSMFGSVVPIVGTAIGGIIGSIIGLGIGMFAGHHTAKQAVRGARAIASIASEKKLDGRQVSLTNPLKYNISNNVLNRVNQALTTDAQTATSDEAAYHFMKQLREAKNASILRKIPYTDSKAKRIKLNQYISAVKTGSLAVGTNGQIYVKEDGKYTLFLTQNQINNLVKAKSAELPAIISKRKAN